MKSNIEFNPYLNEQQQIKDNEQAKDENEQPGLYTVQKGDSLMKISYQYNVSERSLINENNLSSKDLFPGQVLKLPLKFLKNNSTSNKNHIFMGKPSDNCQNQSANVLNQNLNSIKSVNNVKDINPIDIIMKNKIQNQKEDRESNLSLNKFLTGFKKSEKDQKKKEEPAHQPTKQFSVFGKIMDTYQYLTKNEKSKQQNTEDDDFIEEDFYLQFMKTSEPLYTTFVTSDYLIENKNASDQINYDSNQIEQDIDFYMKTDCLYMIKYDQIYGNLILKNDCLIFLPFNMEHLKNEDREHHKFQEYNHNNFIKGMSQQNLNEYEATIDYLDIVEVNKMFLINEKALDSSYLFQKDAYKYDWFLQIILSSVNGITLKQDLSLEESQGAILDGDLSIIKRNEAPIANLYLKFSHIDVSDEQSNQTLLTNSYQEIVVETLQKKLESKIQECKKNKVSDQTMTYVPYHDLIIEKSQRSNMSQAKMNPLTEAKVKQRQMVIISQESNYQKPNSDDKIINDDNNQKSSKIKIQSSQMMEYMPKKSHQSVILNDLQISNLIGQLPIYYRQSEWKRCFSLDLDGCSLITFFQNCKEQDTTILICQDQFGYKFGGFCNEAWKQNHKFFGNGQNFLFSFKDQDEPIVYRWQGLGEQHMYADDKSLGLGGSKTKGRFAFYLSNDLYRGSSVKVESYENEILSKQSDFKCCHLEVWAILD